MNPYPIRTLTNLHIAEVTSNEIPCGLDNLGNTCYISCILQALKTIPLLVDYFLLGRHMDDLIPDSQSTSMSEEFTNVLRHLCFPNASSSFAPTSFRDYFQQRYSQFLHNAQISQHDCVEFTSLLLSGLHEELKFGSSPYRRGPGGDRSVHADHSIISDVFDGQTQSTITCQQCQHKSVTSHVFQILMLEIPPGDGPFTLKKCLELYSNPEEMNDVLCSRCNKRGNSTKRMTITIIPPVLVIQLKRFGRNGSKINSNIILPEKLDLLVGLVP